MSDNASESSYDKIHKQKKHQDKFRHTKQGQTDTFKLDLGRKTQTFHSDAEESHS